jgi:hypothetical protein
MCTHEYCDDDEGDVHVAGVEEGAAVCDVDPAGGRPLAHFDERVLLQLEQVQLKLDAAAFFKLYRSTQAFELHL